MVALFVGLFPDKDAIAFLEVDLKHPLDEIGAPDLVIVGNQTEFCIDTTCRRAVSEGYSVTLLSD
ncbi:MAG: isochorismatase family protein [Pseudomonadota bacterium]